MSKIKNIVFIKIVLSFVLIRSFGNIYIYINKITKKTEVIFFGNKDKE